MPDNGTEVVNFSVPYQWHTTSYLTAELSGAFFRK